MMQQEALNMPVCPSCSSGRDLRAGTSNANGIRNPCSVTFWDGSGHWKRCIQTGNVGLPWPALRPCCCVHCLQMRCIADPQREEAVLNSVLLALGYQKRDPRKRYADDTDLSVSGSLFM